MWARFSAGFVDWRIPESADLLLSNYDVQQETQRRFSTKEFWFALLDSKRER